MLGGEGQTVSVAVSKQPVLVLRASAPNRADGVNDVAGRKPKARRDLCLPRLAAAEFGASTGELRTGGMVDRAADTSAGGKHGVGGVDDSVDVEPGDVAFDDLNALAHAPIGTPIGVPIKPRSAHQESIPRQPREESSLHPNRRCL